MRLGLTIVGDSLDHFRQYVQQADTAGVEQLWSPVRFADKAPLMRAICEDLMPHLAQL
jgi:hypothetical protein